MNAEQSISQNDIAGVVVLYNSSPDCLENIKTYITQLHRLYVVDNSPTTSPWIANSLLNHPRVRYHHFPQNAGIATALNVGAQQAINDGYRYLLTMDDDSRAPVDMIPKMIRYLATSQPDTIGILAPKHILSVNIPEPLLPEKSLAIDVRTTMTSGNLVNLAAYQRVGHFDDGLFIDVVDHDFDLRLKAAGYRIVELTDLHLVHRLGTPKRVRFTGLTYISHSPARNYYLVRNSLVVAIRNRHNYPFYLLTALLTVSIEIVKAALVEDKRLLRLRLIGKALADGIRKRTGKLSDAY